MRKIKDIKDLKPIKQFQYLEVDQQARASVRATGSYSGAIQHAVDAAKLFNIHEDVLGWILHAIRLMYIRHGKLTNGKEFDELD